MSVFRKPICFRKNFRKREKDFRSKNRKSFPLVRVKGLEPLRRKALEPKSKASTNSAIPSYSLSRCENLNLACLPIPSQAHILLFKAVLPKGRENLPFGPRRQRGTSAAGWNVQASQPTKCFSILAYSTTRVNVPAGFWCHCTIFYAEIVEPSESFLDTVRIPRYNRLWIGMALCALFGEAYMAVAVSPYTRF